METSLGPTNILSTYIHGPFEYNADIDTSYLPSLNLRSEEVRQLKQPLCWTGYPGAHIWEQGGYFGLWTSKVLGPRLSGRGFVGFSRGNQMHL